VRTSDAIDPASRTLLVEIDVTTAPAIFCPARWPGHFKAPVAQLTLIVPAAALIFRKEGCAWGW